MPTILSTKKLAENQKQLLLHANCSLVEYNAIKIELNNFQIPDFVENAIITSQNTVRSIINSEITLREKIQNCFCVGEKTRKFLIQNNFNIVECAEYASALSDVLIEKYNERKFHFFCGNIRSDEIPLKLKENNIAFEVIEVYKTTLNKKQFKRNFDAIMFFSPSGVRSYFDNNKADKFESVAVCIGKTTADEAEKYAENVVVANNTTIESMIAKTVKILKRIDNH